MKTIFYLPEDKKLADELAYKTNFELGRAEIRQFPDGENYIRIDSDVQDKTIFLICRLDHPNKKILNIFFLSHTLKKLGAKKIFLISPYLPYMRQDKSFKQGEAITSVLFADFLSNCIDQLITIDPHLHRFKKLSEIYSIPTITLHLDQLISEWIKKNTTDPFLIGPDEESQPWVSEIANHLSIPFIILEKTRRSDNEVVISLPNITYEEGRTPVIIDDIISTGSSMLATINELSLKGFSNTICIATHALFDDEIYKKLLNAGAGIVISSNSIEHLTNKIDITDLLTDEMIRC